MTKALELLNESIIELRSYMFQSYAISRPPLVLLRVEELLLEVKDEMDKPALISRDDTMGADIKEGLMKMNNVISTINYGK